MNDCASSSANVAYELTFLIIGLVALAFLLIKRQPYVAKEEGAKLTGAIFETIGQFAYIKAIVRIMMLVDWWISSIQVYGRQRLVLYARRMNLLLIPLIDNWM